MPSTRLDLLDFASNLSQQGSEPAFRSAVSRAYYAAFHHGVAVIDSKLPISKSLVYTGGCHQQLYEKLLDGKSSAWKGIAYEVNELKELRVIADYRLNKTVTYPTALIAVNHAKSIISKLDAI